MSEHGTKKKIRVSDSNQTHHLLNTRWELYPLSAHLVFERSWIQLLLGTQIFSLSQPCVMLINSPLHFVAELQIHHLYSQLTEYNNLLLHVQSFHKVNILTWVPGMHAL